MIKEVEAGVGSVDQGQVATLRSRYESDEDIEWSISPGASIIESTNRECTVETTYSDSMAFKLNGKAFYHRRYVKPSKGKQDINKVEPRVKPCDTAYPWERPEPLTEINKTVNKTIGE